jgi:energy-coupling factor transporter ATP-binding protein EcfA2
MASVRREETGALVVLRSFGVSFGQRVVLAEITLELPRCGLTIVVGPSGSGKSTLLRTLAGLNGAHPSLSTWGEKTDARLVPSYANGKQRGFKLFLVKPGSYYAEMGLMDGDIVEEVGGVPISEQSIGKLLEAVRGARALEMKIDRRGKHLLHRLFVE